MVAVVFLDCTDDDDDECNGCCLWDMRLAAVGRGRTPTIRGRVLTKGELRDAGGEVWEEEAKDCTGVLLCDSISDVRGSTR